MELRDLIMLSRKRSKRSQGEIARQLETNRATVSCWETGHRLPSLISFARLCKVLNWDDETIFDILDELGKLSEDNEDV